MERELRRAGVISNMSELLSCAVHCAITVQWSFTALRRRREWETKMDRERERVRGEWDRRQLTPPLLLLPAEWGVLHFLRAMQRTRKKRLTSVKVTIQQTQKETACGGQRHWEEQRHVETHRWTAIDTHGQTSCSIHHEASAAVECSASRHQRTESFSHPKNYAHLFQCHCLIFIWLFYD